MFAVFFANCIKYSKKVVGGGAGKTCGSIVMDFMDACQGSLKFCSLVLGMDNVQQTLCLVVCNFICISAFVVVFLNMCLCFCI